MLGQSHMQFRGESSKLKKWIFPGSRGAKGGGGVDLMHAMHFDAIAIHILIGCEILFNFGINIIFTYAKILSFHF